jgi:SAM-dependent methyltransferase
MNVFNEEAETFAEYWTDFSAPARVAVADAIGLGAGVRVLDVGCGSGAFCALALERGARASGIDAAPAMIALAGRNAPRADLCVGPLERLPWADGAFDALTSFNSIQFAEDPVAALREWMRVTRPGGTIAVSVWGPRDECEYDAVEDVIRTTKPGPRSCERLVETVEAAGLTLLAHESVSVPLEVPDRDRLERTLAFDARAADMPEADALAALLAAAEPFRRADGSYRFENVFRYAITRRP